MGCDIHAHSELKINGEWQHLSDLDIDRNYALFSKMAGVRGKHSPVAEPRGLPIDMSLVTKYNFEKMWKDDAHTCSWLNAAEVVEVGKWWEDYAKSYDPNGYPFYESIFGYIFSNGWEYYANGKTNPRLPEVTDVRLVFWFDN